MRLVFLLCAGLGAALALTNCQSGTSSSTMTPAAATAADRFELSVGPAVPDGYPATIYEGRVRLPGGGALPIPAGHFLPGSWGSSGTGMPGGVVPVPDSLELLWFSYADNKFYEGRFLLPRERMRTLLREGIWVQSEQKHETYNELTVCLLPTGVVVVWLSGRNQVLLGRYQCRETTLDWGTFMPKADRAEAVEEGLDEAKMPAEVRAQIAAGTLTAKQWDDYLPRYPWKLEFSQKLQLYDYGVNYLNAEVFDYPTVPDPKGPEADLNATAFRQHLLAVSDKPVPEDLILFVRGTYGDQHQIRLDPFDEAETMAAFRTLHTAAPGQPLTLHVEVDSLFRKGTLTLRQGSKSLELRKTKVRFFQE